MRIKRGRDEAQTNVTKLPPVKANERGGATLPVGQQKKRMVGGLRPAAGSYELIPSSFNTWRDLKNLHVRVHKTVQKQGITSLILI